MNENNSPASDVLPAQPVPPQTATAPGVSAAPLPPAAALALNGEVQSERVLALERKLRDAETRAAELERDNQRLQEVPAELPAPPKPAKVKRKPGWSDPVFDNSYED
jgi:hypothetical protein